MIHCLHERFPECPGSREDALCGHDVTSALVHYHWSVLSRFYVRNMDTVRKEAQRMEGRMQEVLNGKIASLS